MEITTTGITSLAAGLLPVSSTTALGNAGHGKAPEFGRTGNKHHVSRTYEVRQGETYFKPGAIRAMPGGTVRFVVVKEGDAVREFDRGNGDARETHPAEMNRMVDEGTIDYDVLRHGKMREMGKINADPNAVLLEPGERAEIIWTFPDEVVEVGISCNVPGHREAGMVQEVIFRGEG